MLTEGGIITPIRARVFLETGLARSGFKTAGMGYFLPVGNYFCRNTPASVLAMLAKKT
jgi:hypothetical protein